MKFLVDIRLPFLNGAVNGPTQSLIAEAAFWTVAMLLYSHVASKYARRWARKMGFWSNGKDRSGIFCGNGQDDNVLLFLWGIHHFIAGSMMVYGLRYGDNAMWRHGYLLECGFEIADTLSILIPLYPYKMDGVKAEMKPAAIFHHAVGTTLAYPILTTVLASNEHIQAIAMWLLLGAVVSCAAACFNYSLDSRRHKLLMTLSLTVSFAFFLYCRFYQFPRHALQLLQDVKNDPFAPEDYGDMEIGTVLTFLYMGLTFMTLFNLGIAADLTPKVARYIKSTLDGGATPLEVGPVPRCRDSLHRHRASVLAFLSEVSGASPRSSKVLVSDRHQSISSRASHDHPTLSAASWQMLLNGKDGGDSYDEDDESSLEEDEVAVIKTVKLLGEGRKNKEE